MVEQVTRSTLERQLRSARREVRRKEKLDVSEAASGAALEAERANDINDVVFKEVAAKELSEIVENLAERCLEGDEGRRLERNNIRLRARVSDLESEIGALRRDFTERTARAVEQEREMMALRMEVSGGINKQSDELAGLSVNGIREIMAGFVSEIKGELLADIMRAVGGMMNAKLDGIGDRLLLKPTIRPPLAASRVVDVGHFGGVEGSAARRGTYEVGNVAMEGVTENWSTVTGKKGKGKKLKAVPASKPSCGTSGVASSTTPLVVAVPPDPLKLPVGGQS
ncbi:unnamed protein product [Pieris macdunnoughi]|uniref:Uncharacterized protein n=1 Tax=Pieris macdunnoughi TaxID=345717 RepID=A0A821UII6_9NEOP|nr:unnamed protein product [Pieris macdunnoughi]